MGDREPKRTARVGIAVLGALKRWTEAQRRYLVMALQLQEIAHHLVEKGYWRLETREGGKYQSSGA